MTLNAVTCVSFDVWNTLIRPNPEFRSLRNALIHEHFKVETDLDLFAEIANKIDKQHTRLTEVTGRHLYTSQMVVLILQQLDNYVQEVTPVLLLQLEERLEELFWKHPPLLRFSDTQQALEHLRAKSVNTCILSNTGFVEGKVLRLFWQKQNLNQYFGFQCYSDEVGFCKPHEQIFKAVYNGAKNTGPCHRSAFLHIGDSYFADYTGATAFGFNSCLIKNDNQSLMEIVSSYV